MGPGAGRTLLGCCAAVALLLAGCVVDPSDGGTAPTTSVGTATTSPGSDDPSPPEPSATARIDGLRVESEHSREGYDRDLFDHWIDADGDGCDTRCEVLESERRTDLPGLAGGGWHSYFDGETTADPADFDIDHVVALGEAWDSGAWNWDADRRRRFANDLDHGGALAAVTASTNRSKGDRDPASWQPPARDAWCSYAEAWVATKARWGLAADPPEATALENMTVDC